MKIPKMKVVGVILILVLILSALPVLGTQSDIILPTASGAKLTGLIKNDQGLDADGDGLYDFLNVGVQINVTEPDVYTVSISGLTNATGGYINVYNSTTAFIDSGLRVVNLTLSGPNIYLSHINPSKVYVIYLYFENTTQLDSVYSAPLSTEYSYLLFESPGASLTGNISDKGIDTDGDSLFNVLEIGVTINVTETGKYKVGVSGLRDSSWNYINVYNSTLLLLNSGTQNVSLQLNGPSIRISGFDPAYVSTVSLTNDKYGEIDTKWNVPLTKTYSHLAFEPPKAFLTGKINDAGIDTDEDGKFNYLQIDVEINVTDAGTYSVSVYGLKNASGSKTIDVSDYQRSYFAVGVHVLNLSLYGPTIYASHMNPEYVSSIWLDADYPSYRLDVPLSRQYLYSEFDSPGAYLTGTISDHAVDTDGDSKLNYLEVGVQINVTEAGDYNIYLSGLLDLYHSSLSFGLSEWEHFNTGIQEVYFTLDGLRIRLAQFNPMYIDHVSLEDQDYHFLGSIDDVPLSREYQYTEFEPPPAALTGVIYDKGEDTDGDGLYNYLKVGVEINVIEAGEYEIQVSQLRNASGNYIDVYSSAHLYLDVGIHVLNVSLNGVGIYLSKQNPRYVDYISLRDRNYNELGSVKYVPLSRQYDYTEFDPPGAVLTGVIFDQGVDTDADGTYDYLKVGVQINVTDPGRYSVSMNRLLDSSYNEIDVYSSNSTLLQAGLQVIYLSLEGTKIYMSHLNPRYVDYISLQDERYTFYDTLGHVPLSREYYYTEFDPPEVMLTGKIYDRGVDTDGDGLFNYLEIDVEVNVTRARDYSVYVYGLKDSYGSYISVWNSTQSYLNIGVGFLNVSLSGYVIRGSHVNPAYVNSIALSTPYSNDLHNVQLSKAYNYTEFDAAAYLTGVIFDKGIDTDSDGKYNLLEIDTQINVSEPGTYQVSINGLLESTPNGTYINVYNSTYLHLDASVQFVNLTLDGTRIYLSHQNPRYVSQISLHLLAYYNVQDYLVQAPLSKQYYYSEFDPPGAMLTGKISDRGVDEDSDGKFDWLEIGVELNVTKTGSYYISAWGLRSPGYNSSYYGYEIYVSDSKTVDLNVGIQTVNLYFYGPEIYRSHLSVANISNISVSNNKGQYHSLYNIPLSRTYSYTDFDAPSTNVETKIVVYPDGRVTLEGSLKYTNMYPMNEGPTATGSFNLTANGAASQASAGLTVTLPQDQASLFPFNSTTASLLATYSNGLLNLGIDSTITLPSGDNMYQPYGQWPFNTTDGSILLTYSGGILNIEVNSNSTLPPMATSQLPFNSTNLKVIGNYDGTTLDGTITFDIMRQIPFDDVNVDFTGNKTDLTLNGTVTVVFGAALGSLVIKNSTELDSLIDELKSTIPGENGIVWNATAGNLNVTTFDIQYTLLESWGAKVTFKVEVQGDFVNALTHIVSNGRNTELLYPVLDEAYKSAKSGSFLIDYLHSTGKASVKLTFSYDLISLVENAITPPSGTLTYVIASSSMYPTLMAGDVVFVQPVPDAANIVADPENGDIIAFHRPDAYSEIIIHRAVSKTSLNGTWYFETKGDNNYYSDSWSVPANLILGKVVRRVPLLGFLLSPSLLGYSWYYQNTAIPLQLADAALDSLQEASIRLSYSSQDRQFDLKLTSVDRIKWLRDNITQTLPELWPPETPPEIKEFFEKLLNTTYTSISSAHISASYANGVADVDATVDIAGDINKEINYAKDLWFQLLKISYSKNPYPYNMTIPWQFDFLNQTSVSLNKFKISAQLGETTFEGRVQGITIIPPREIINATDFTLERFLNLTAPQNSGGQEFPGLNQRLKITIQGGSNATHMVTLFRPETVPEPSSTGPYSKSMVWNNQTLSSLKDLIFKIGPRLTGTLTVGTAPVQGEVFVDGESWGLAPQSRVIDVGIYDVSFGSVASYRTPAMQSVLVDKDVETTVTGVYTAITGTLTITTSPVSGQVLINGVSWGMGPQSRIVLIGTYTVSFGAREGLTTPANQVATVNDGAETTVTGVYQSIPGIVVKDIESPDLVTQSNPFIVDAKDEASTHITITDVSDHLTIIVKNVAIPTNAQPPDTWKVLGDCVQITANDTDVTVNATIRIYYTLDQLKAAGIDEGTLKIYYWNATSSQWVASESDVNANEHYVSTTVDHFGTWVIMGQSPAQPTMIWLIVGGIIIAAVIVALAATVYFRRRKPQTPTSSKPDEK